METFRGSFRSISNPHAFAALARFVAARVGIRVSGCVFMALRAMGLQGLPSNTSADVFSAGHDLKMPCVATSAVSTPLCDVIQDHPLGDGAIYKLPGHSVGSRGFSSTSADAEPTIAIGGNGCSPQPAGIRILRDGDLRPEPFSNGLEGLTPDVGAGANPMLAAEPPRDWLGTLAVGTSQINHELRSLYHGFRRSAR